MFRLLFVFMLVAAFMLSGCSGGPRTVSEEDGSSYLQLSLSDEVSIISSIGQSRSYPSHAIILTTEESLLAALQKLYPDYWFSELADLPDGSFDVAIIPPEGVSLDLAQQQRMLRRAFEMSFKLRIQINDEDKIATIKGRIL